MIAAFYDKDFNPLYNNATLAVDDKGYKLIKRPVELNELSFTCEAFDQDIKPTFLVVTDDRDRYVYGCLAGVPVVNDKNQAEIHGTDLKLMLDSDVIINYPYGFGAVHEAIEEIFTNWAVQLGYGLTVYIDDKPIVKNPSTGVMDCELHYVDAGYHYVTRIRMNHDGYFPIFKIKQYNALDELQNLLRYYNLYLETELDIVNKKIKFIIGQTMIKPISWQYIDGQLNAEPQNIKLWEYGIKNYGKITVDVNECQGLVVISEDKPADATHPEPYTVDHWYSTYNNVSSTKWILLSNGDITTTPANRDIYPIKRRIVTSSEDMYDANRQALEQLLDVKYNEDIELPATDIKPKFETLFNVYTREGDGLYKQLPCGELQYDATGLIKFKIGYRYTGVNFI